MRHEGHSKIFTNQLEWINISLMNQTKLESKLITDCFQILRELEWLEKLAHKNHCANITTEPLTIMKK